MQIYLFIVDAMGDDINGTTICAKKNRKKSKAVKSTFTM